jgi:hypothetical protein
LDRTGFGNNWRDDMAHVTEIEAAYPQARPGDWAETELRKTLLAGFLGALVASAAYFIYSRLEEKQKEALRRTVGKFVSDKVADIRSQLNF